jgi:hypothetical protein
LAILSIAALMFLWHRQGRVGPVGAWKAATLVPRLPTAILTTGIYGPCLYCASLRDNSGFSMQGQTRR